MVDRLGDRHGPGHGEQDVAVIPDAGEIVSRDGDLRGAVVDGRPLATLTNDDRPGGDPVCPPVGGPRAPAARTPA
ncbi:MULTISPECIES: hypothetical protein [Streptomyces]|uniref:Amidohydrolase 3 domain-containing protein n=1 Tax=Streptomyces virginiae TaxID=1961 RepID=A0ABZ1TEL5_STRVG|nr:hypothetical protein [Streptomyces virginiae]WTB23664.1 hypothetical protein OG253_20305 [Streptomyces virginiae]